MRRQARFGWVVALMVAGWAADGWAQAAAWEDIGPPGGVAFELAVSPADPQVIWAVTTRALYRSTDGGATWARASTDRPHFRSSAELALSPSDAGTAFLSVSGEALRRTTDGGATWQVTGPLAAAATVATVPGADPPTVLAAGDGQTLVRSSDGGETWEEVATTIDPNPTSSAVAQVVPATAISGLVYARTAFSLHRSDDGGATWRLASSERLPVAVHPEEPLVVYALSFFFSSSRRSDDGGVHWRTLDGAPSTGLTALAFDPVDPATLYAATRDGLYRSTDRGESWAPHGGFGDWDSLESVAVDPSDPRALVVGGNLDPPGVWRSTDGGGSWAASAAGLPGAEVFSLATDPGAPRNLYVAGFRLERSRDRGATWATLLDRPVASVALDPRSHGSFWVASSPGLLHSTDDGATWVTVSDLVTDRVVVDPHRAGTLYARARVGGWVRSDDAGSTWVVLHAPAVEVLVPHPARAGLLVAGGWDGIARSWDRGESWVGVSGLPIVPPPCTVRPCYVYDLALHPLRPESLIAATECGLFSSDDWGATWRLSDDGLPAVTCEMNVWGCYACDGPRVVEANPARPGMVIAVAGDGLYSSRDFGATWRPLPTSGLPELPGAWTDLEQPARPLGFTGDGSGLLAGTEAGLYALWLDQPRRPWARWRPPAIGPAAAHSSQARVIFSE